MIWSTCSLCKSVTLTPAIASNTVLEIRLSWTNVLNIWYQSDGSDLFTRVVNDDEESRVL